jgi:REP element-mobilizing transposase RayT
MADANLNIRRRNLPHWTLDGSTYFITFRLQTGELNASERAVVVQHLRNGHGKYYRLAAAVVMPDHVHLILRPEKGFELSRIMKGIKGASAHLINVLRGSKGTVWQDESWDRILRDAAEFEEKLEYMAKNPVKAGLCRAIEEYDGWICAGELL